MHNFVYKGKTLSFVELLTEHKIEIPIIQRDYAQGRAESANIRQDFLLALRESLENKTKIELDFIYGNIEEQTFQPLDGQQRLTTLFLLHWYASIKDMKNDHAIKNLLSKFSYETRISSREFCRALIYNQLSIDDISTKLSDMIIDANWFFLSWKKDPTIVSMLSTIDDIHKYFFEIDNLWDGLTNNDLISFYYVELENIGLTDDLYIKMNARGKLLTPFENFKAGLQKLANSNGWEATGLHIEKFSFKIDTSWTDYFWSNFKKSNSVDSAHMRFISAIAMYRIVLERLTPKPEERYQTIQRFNDHPEYVKPSNFSKEAFEYLKNCYEIYLNVEKDAYDISLPFPLWRHQPRNSILSAIVYEDNQNSQTESDSASYTLKVLFYAQTEYLRRIKNFDRDSFLDWMRVVRNIISRGDVDKDGKRPDIIRSPQTFDGVINLISELAEGCSDIYGYLSSLYSLRSTFAKDQIEEEKNKAKLIKSNPKIKELIWKTEDNELLRGHIDFIFYCIDYKYDLISFDENKFSNIQGVFEKYFNTEFEISPDLRRAMLTIEVNGEYEFYNYWWSFWNVINATKRKLFDNYRELEYFTYSEQKEYFKKLILKLIEKDFSEIILDFQPPQSMPYWKVRLIKDETLLNNNKSNYIAIPDDNSCCYLLKSKRPRDMDGCIKIE